MGAPFPDPPTPPPRANLYPSTLGHHTERKAILLLLMIQGVCVSGEWRIAGRGGMQCLVRCPRHMYRLHVAYASPSLGLL